MSTITGTTSASAGNTTATKDRQLIGQNFDTFLQILTTQLMNQNPLDPLDTHQFTNQLVQFSSVEQQIKTNDQLEKLLTLSTGQTTSHLVNYLGKTVSANGASLVFNGQKATWSYEAAESSSDATVTIRDSKGQTVYTEKTSIEEGKGEYSWNGNTLNGGKAPVGVYQITIEARDSNKNAINVSTKINGKVTGIDLSGPEPILEIGDIRIALSAVTAVKVE